MFGLKNSVLNFANRSVDPPVSLQDIAKQRSEAVASGLTAGTRVASTTGWRPVEAIAEGDQVLTFDDGMQVVKHISRSALWVEPMPCPIGLWPLKVPAGALGNAEEMFLLPEQYVLIESDAADEFFGDPFAMVTAAALQGMRGIKRVNPQEPMEVITLHFETEQVVFANLGVMFHCPAAKASDLVSEPVTSRYDVLSQNQASLLSDYFSAEFARAAGEPAALENLPYAAFG